MMQWSRASVWKSRDLILPCYVSVSYSLFLEYNERLWYKWWTIRDSRLESDRLCCFVYTMKFGRLSTSVHKCNKKLPFACSPSQRKFEIFLVPICEPADWSSGSDSNIYWDITIQMVYLDLGHSSPRIPGHLDAVTPLYFSRLRPMVSCSGSGLIRAGTMHHRDRGWQNSANNVHSKPINTASQHQHRIIHRPSVPSTIHHILHGAISVPWMVMLNIVTPMHVSVVSGHFPAGCHGSHIRCDNVITMEAQAQSELTASEWPISVKWSKNELRDMILSTLPSHILIHSPTPATQNWPQILESPGVVNIHQECWRWRRMLPDIPH